jgi:hypothetical protein
VSREANPLDLLGCDPDEGLLAGDPARLPPSLGAPAPLPGESPLRRQVVRLGAALTGVSLLLGIALIGVGIAVGVSGAVGLAVALVVVGLACVGTHWGWVHVAELTGNAIQGRRDAPALARRRAWLESLEPYPRWEVSTSTEEDGSIAILTHLYRPVASGERTFTFVREEVARELHGAEEPGAAVAERAEILRRAARAETERARERFEAARDAYQQALLARDDEHQRRLALRAASEALSERINANLRDPPLTE